VLAVSGGILRISLANRDCLEPCGSPQDYPVHFADVGQSLGRTMSILSILALYSSVNAPRSVETVYTATEHDS